MGDILTQKSPCLDGSEAFSLQPGYYLVGIALVMGRGGQNPIDRMGGIVEVTLRNTKIASEI